MVGRFDRTEHRKEKVSRYCRIGVNPAACTKEDEDGRAEVEHVDLRANTRNGEGVWGGGSGVIVVRWPVAGGRGS